jgi:hypothetical protein
MRAAFIEGTTEESGRERRCMTQPELYRDRPRSQFVPSSDRSYRVPFPLFGLIPSSARRTMQNPATQVFEYL